MGDKGFIWNPSNCECECDKMCDVGENLDYENCKCRKRLTDKLINYWNNNFLYAIPLNIWMVNNKEINIKNRTYYFFDDIINIKDFDSNLLKIKKKSDKNIDIYCFGYITRKDFDYVKINSVNPLYLIIGEVDGCIEEKMEINI